MSTGDEREELTLRGLARWLVVAAVIAAGIGLYFAVGRRVQPVVPVPALESSP
ncbi:MAG TPA: hypothetical protein VFW66_15150 [Gemmatimonadales bacterium]|nr:hypothetical protein [Gemmatimonadales bacterium]